MQQFSDSYMYEHASNRCIAYDTLSLSVAAPCEPMGTLFFATHRNTLSNQIPND